MNSTTRRYSRTVKRARYLTKVNDAVNAAIGSIGKELFSHSPIYIVDLNNPDYVTVQFFSTTRDPELSPCIVTNRGLYGQNKYWGEVLRKPSDGLWLLRTKHINADCVIHTSKLLFELTLDLGKDNPTEEITSEIFKRYKQ